MAMRLSASISRLPRMTGVVYWPSGVGAVGAVGISASSPDPGQPRLLGRDWETAGSYLCCLSLSSSAKSVAESGSTLLRSSTSRYALLPLR